MSKPKKQHIVPQCYLREFLDPFIPPKYEPYVWIFDKDGKNRKNKPPKNILTGNELYTLDIPGHGKDYSVEESLSQLEDRYARIFRNKIKLGLPLTDEEHVFLSAFTYAMLHRTLRFKRNIENFLDQVIESARDLEIAHGATSERSDQLRDYKKNAHSLNLIQILPNMSRLLSTMSLAFMCAPKVGSRFITSDNPCFFFNPDLQWEKSFFNSPGLSQKNIHVYLPLSPKILLCMTWHNLKGYINIDSQRVDEINRMIRAHADKHLISQLPRTKVIWFSPLPMDFIFGLKFMRFQVGRFFGRLRGQQ